MESSVHDNNLTDYIASTLSNSVCIYANYNDQDSKQNEYFFILMVRLNLMYKESNTGI